MDNMRKNAYFINIKDLIVECIRKLPMIMIVAVICTVLFVGANLVMDDTESSQLSKEELEAVLTEDELSAAKNYLKATANYEKFKEDLEKSTFMKFSTDKAIVGTLNYVIEGGTDAEIESSSIMITNYMKRTELIEDLSIAADEIVYKEYVSVYASGTNSQIVCVNVYHDNADECKKLVSVVDKALIKYANEVLNEGGEIRKIAEVYQKDLEYVAFVQKDYKNRLAQLNQEKAAIAATLNGNQIQYIDALQEDVQAQPVETNGFSFKVVLLGMIIGVAAGAVVAVVWYLFSNNIKYSEEIESMYGINHLGTIVETEKNDWASKVNGIFYKEYKKESLSLIVARLMALLNKEDSKDISIITDTNDEKMIKTLGEDLANRNLKVKVWETLYNNEQALNDLGLANNVLFVIKLRKSSYEIIQKEINYCNKQGINIVGYIVRM